MTLRSDKALATEYQLSYTDAPYARTNVRDLDLSMASDLWPGAVPIFEELQAREAKKRRDWRERKARERERLRAEGLRRLELWVRPEHVERIRRYVARLK